MGNEVNLILPHFALNDDHMDEIFFFDKAKFEKMAICQSFNNLKQQYLI